MYDQAYEPTEVYGIFKTEKAAQKAIDIELQKCSEFRALIQKLLLNPSELTINYLYRSAD